MLTIEVFLKVWFVQNVHEEMHLTPQVNRWYCRNLFKA